ncbi:MAG: amidohydrolase, partial [Solirubrobacterales bacterium]|nr:amidohydrolase [Solirubrobacterales bacterium]
VMALLERRIEETAIGVAAALGATAEVEYTRGYGAVVNDAAVTDTVADTARELFGAARVTEGVPLMAGEDFSAFQREAPGCFVLVGAGNAERGIVHEHHHPRFDIDEDSLDHGVRLLAHTAIALQLGDVPPGSR